MLASRQPIVLDQMGKQMTDKDDDTQDYVRPWKGLTNEELTDLLYNTNLGQASAVLQAIALLKERNS